MPCNHTATDDQYQKALGSTHSKCSQCSLARNLICLDCLEAFCRQHAQGHNHPLHVDFTTRDVYCTGCDSFVFDNIQYDEVKQSSMLKLDLQYSKNGVAGLVNLGATCFMNVILQSLLSNPLLRNWFMSDGHNSQVCKQNCVACQLDGLFQLAYSDASVPIVPASMLYATWTYNEQSGLVGYAQQDAHEFFIAVLDMLHQDFLKYPGNRFGTRSMRSLIHATGNSNCQCMVHAVFSGKFQSTVTCLQCDAQTQASDPFLDISLDIRPVFQSAPVKLEDSPATRNTRHSKSPSRRNSLVHSEQTENLMTKHTLYECLDRFTYAEQLQSHEYKCDKCQRQGSQSAGASKQLSFSKLPLVLAMQLKRYKHGYDQTSNKLEMMIDFPPELDMSAYITDSMNTQDLSEDNYIYKLFCVIEHDGDLSSGHYTCYVRHMMVNDDVHKWYRMDDGHVYPSDWQQVSQCQAYMLFYSKKVYDYSL